ncbi:lipase family protein [Aliikangiella maris]|uniref:Lipase family protein n=2 Tax=Aliikangiella maris TaxID=3162458 RepID=A0ABV2BWP6_9GAMM
MMVKTLLKPNEAANAARTAYEFRGSNDLFSVYQEYEISELFRSDHNSSELFSGKAGAFGFKTSIGFGVLAMGKGRFENQALLACRGTATFQDVLTDLNPSPRGTGTGSVAHSGFVRNFASFKSNIHRFISIHRPEVIHCVGHSLGGALATLAADSIIHSSQATQTVLYTFGCPRVGTQGFAQKLSSHRLLGKDNIHRVYHSSDPVAMLPLWPFVHVPLPTGECYIGCDGFAFNPMKHSMLQYAKSVSGKTWLDLKRPHPTWNSRYQGWVKAMENAGGGGLSLAKLSILNVALNYMSRKVFKLSFQAFITAGMGVMTPLDQISYLLDKAAHVSTENKGLVAKIVSYVLRICGYSGLALPTLTLASIYHAFRTLIRLLNGMARLAMNAAH